MLDITWTVVAIVPQLDQIHQTIQALGERLMANIAGIQAEIANLVAKQTDEAQALADQLTVIADEISQLRAGQIDQGELDALAAQIREAATTAGTQAEQTRANSAQIAGMIPDAPPTP